MIVVYYDYGGTHTSVVAAAVHLGRLNPEKVPEGKELIDLPLFDRITQSDLGHIIYNGTSIDGNNIYTLGLKKAKNLVIPAVEDMYKAVFGNTDGLYLVDVSSATNFYMKLGGLLSRGMRLQFLGLPLVVYGTRKAYRNIVRLVFNTKNAVKDYPGIQK
ncbi:DUF3189 family protein [Calorimonas adulescens]|jgi:Protein of unknown function (DUF3189).|uniref:DUF3189 family protein n=1 Tax=Calorimonas adulescens TaxID=2606906 RepID=A0A5D8QGD2_9THEO|nr:DUF3189 family protein [Calorimonas adulescens]TZE83592.1 DUF3189 family protein [Calorimonas adulescens]